jgi:anti-sigma B factor antagonist
MTSLKIRIRNAGPTTILDLEGPLKLGETQGEFRDQVQRLIAQGSTHIAVNLAGVSDLDSSGIGALVRAFTTLKRSGGKCTFFSPTERVQMLLKMVRLDDVWLQDAQATQPEGVKIVQ